MADLFGANRTRTDLARVNLTEVRHLARVQLDTAIGDTHDVYTQLPPGLRRPDTWSR
jgi:hypothetical protein